MRHLLQNKAFRLFVGLFTLFMFTGDLVADTIIGKPTLKCENETDCGGSSSNSEQDDCPAGECAIQSGAAICLDRIDPLPDMIIAVIEVMISDDQQAPSGALLEIDYPPQLS